MIKNSHNPLVVGFFDWYLMKILKSDFHQIRYDHNFEFDQNKSVLFIGNHFSWWDGFFTYYLKIKHFKKDFNVMMLEEELAKRMFLTRCGVFSVRKNSRDLLESLNYASELLQDPLNVVTIYPSGEIISHHQQNFSFKQGFARIACRHDNNSHIVFAVVLVDHFSLARPEIRIYLKKYSGERTSESIELAYHSLYQSCVTKQTE